VLTNYDNAFGTADRPKTAMSGFLGVRTMTPVSAGIQGSGLSAAGNRPDADAAAAWRPPIG
jgi:hypothetical protein